MLKVIAFIVFSLTSSVVYAGIYTIPLQRGTIHTTSVESKWCGNIAVSTKVGVYDARGQCSYIKETVPESFDRCGPFELNGWRLGELVGGQFNCGATHIHSNVYGTDSLDEFKLRSDGGHYIETDPIQGSVILNSN